jgi:hypothetical protein
MRFWLPVLCLALSLPVVADAAPLKFNALEVGQEGEFPDISGKPDFYVEIQTILSDDQCVVQGVSPNGRTKPLLLKGVNVTKYADGSKIPDLHKVTFKITGTKRVGGFGTIFLLEKK